MDEFEIETDNKRQKHNYTSELELKSLLIRIKNKRHDIGIEKNNTKINKYIIWHTKINNKKYDNPSKRNKVKSKLKEKIIDLSECTSIDTRSYERFGEIILLMVKNILKKPNFSGYTYRDDFYSDAIYKILKYLGNFDHTLISQATGQSVNSFAYISQIIHNSILFIINTKKKENDNLKKQVSLEMLSHNLTLKGSEVFQSIEEEELEKEETIVINKIQTTLVDELEKIDTTKEGIDRYNIYYPKDYRISFDEYNEMKKFFKGNISIMRKKWCQNILKKIIHF